MGNRTKWAVVAAVVGVGLGLVLSARPWGQASAERERTAEATREMQAEEARRAGLERQVAAAQSPVGRERTVRERGYVRPDERPVESSR